MSILIIIDGKSKEQSLKLKQLSTVLDMSHVYVSGLNKKWFFIKNIHKNVNYVVLNTYDYIDKLIFCELIILLSDKISLLKLNKSQKVIAWFDQSFMHEHFLYKDNFTKAALINSYKLDAIVGVKESYQIIDAYPDHEYRLIEKYIKHSIYRLNFFIFDFDLIDEDELRTSSEFSDLISEELSVNILYAKGKYSNYLVSKFDYVFNNNITVKNYLKNRFSINVDAFISKNIHVVNDDYSKTLHLESKRTDAIEYNKKEVHRDEKPLVSIVIPHYNTPPKLLLRAIDSVLKNKYKNIEIIIVDDGSEKNLKDVLSKTYLENENIIIFRKENEGLGLARNSGIKESKGKYIFFLDSDDTVTYDGLNDLVLHSEKYNLMLVSGVVAIVNEDGDLINLSLEYLYGENYMQYRAEDLHKVFYAQMAPGRLLHRDLFIKNGRWFKPGLYEDGPWSAELYSKLDRFDFVNTVSYYWYKYDNRTTISSTATLDNFKERYRAYNDIIKFCDEKTMFNKVNFFFFNEITMYFKNYMNFTDIEKENFFHLIYEFVKVNIRYLDVSKEVSGKKLIETIQFNNFDKFNNIVNLIYKKGEEDLKNNLLNLKYDTTVFKPGETKILYDNVQDGEKNLYIVSTPLQLLGAIEAQHHFKTQNNVLVILFFLIGDGKNIDQMFKLSEYFPYDKLITYQQKRSINITNFIKYIREIQQYEYEYLFFGYGTPIYRRMIANVNYKNLYLLDDGTHSITVHKQLINTKNKKNDFVLTTEPKKVVKKLRNLIYVQKKIKIDTQLDDVNFFTIFDLRNYNHCIMHDFSYVKSLFNINNNNVDNNIYILGQPLNRAIEMETITYIKYLEKIFEYYKDRNIIYIPHRVEPMSDDFKYFLSQKNNLSIVHLDMPIELYFFKNSIVPLDVISFMTTALFTIKKIFPSSEPKYIEIDISPYSKFHQENIQLIYDNYKRDGIEKFNDEI